ncbi:MAG: Ig-like domain-containing protein [Planctomycetota bacterium]|nr:Ig-like domain-containing protein [Planctomycetota bacterium]
MRQLSSPRRPLCVVLLACLTVPALASAHPAHLLAQEAQENAPARELRIEPTELVLDVGETAQLDARVVDTAGNDLEARLLYLSRGRRTVSVTREGLVKAIKPGTVEIIVRERRRRAGENQEGRAAVGARLSGTVEVTVRPPALASLELMAPEAGVFQGTAVSFGVRAVDVNGDQRENPAVTWNTTNPAVASFDAHGELTVHGVGSFDVTAAVDGQEATASLEAKANPIARVVIEGDVEAPRTGDVIHLRVDAHDAAGELVLDVPVDMTFMARPDDTLGPGASGQIESIPGTARAWRFVAEQPGRYTFVASSGGALARTTVRVDARDVAGKFELVGHAPVRDTHTSDLWVWEGLDGRDYCVTGTWGANGDAHFFDVTDPSKMERIATVNIDARTVNDVKVSADGRICVLSREGASNRKNGIVLVDVTDPRDPKILSGFDDELTGGVHNVFIDGNQVYALSAGARYDAIDVSDPGSPRKVGTYKVADRANPSIHDVWIENGLAYSSNWSDGVHIVDVGNGIRGGSPENPVKVSSYAYPSGWNHAAFPYRQPDTGRFYVAAGDEAFPYGLNVTGKPTRPRGWIHFLDFTDLENPVESARYQVPEAGTHNLWIEDGVMYVAYYNAGLRAVDVTGELMGDLYRQGREIAWFLPDDPEGFVANAPMAWGPQPHKGHIFFSDWNSGLWAVKLNR